MQTGQPSRVLHVHHTPRGPEHVNVELTPLSNAEGEIVYFVESLRRVREASTTASASAMVGASQAFNRMLGMIERAAPTATPVLLLGESGTGKEMAAQAVHEASPRSQRPFVVVDCAGLTETLFESELFGYEKGAFTGAANRKIGLVEAAEGGTLFLDEIGELPLSLQVKFLRLLEGNTYRRVGSVETLRADFRLVAATHRDLKAMVARGEFRTDLYYRLAAFPIRIPPLRERMGELKVLADSLLQRLRPDRHLHLAPQTLAVLQTYDFPGNVRELRNVLESASLMCDGDLILPEHLPDTLGELVAAVAPAAGEETSQDAAGPFADLPPGQIIALDEAERRYLQWALKSHGSDRKKLAEKLGVSERTLYRKLEDLE